MISALSILVMMVATAIPPTTAPEPIPDFDSPGDGLGLATNRPKAVSRPRPLTPPIAPPAAALGGLAAVAGLAAARLRSGRRSEADEGPGDGTALGPDVEVLLIDPDGDGKVAFRVGPADAEHVAIYVPGTGADLASALDHGLQRARNLRTAAQLADPATSVAVIYALPFDAPDHVVWHPLSADCACNPHLAEVGAAELTRFVESLDLAGADVTVVGYSYGSTVVGKALADEGLSASVDRAILVGSPGVGVDRAVDLNLDEDAVFVAQSSGDVINYAPRLKPIAIGLGFPALVGLWPGAIWAFGDAILNDRLIHGRDPSAPDFGATLVDSGDFGHGDYFDDVEHLDHIGRVVVGKTP